MFKVKLFDNLYKALMILSICYYWMTIPLPMIIYCEVLFFLSFSNDSVFLVYFKFSIGKDYTFLHIYSNKSSNFDTKIRNCFFEMHNSHLILMNLCWTRIAIPSLKFLKAIMAPYSSRFKFTDIAINNT